MSLEILRPVFLCILLAGTVLPLFSCVAERLLMKKASASTKHRLWMLTAIGLLCFPAIVLLLHGGANESMPEMPVVETEVSPIVVEKFEPLPFQQSTSMPSVSTAPVDQPSVMEIQTASLSASVISPPMEIESVPKEFVSKYILNTTTILWLVGFVLTALYFLTIHFKSTLFLLRIQKDGRKDRRFAGQARLWFSDKTSIPFAFGIFRPTVVFPSEAKDWPKDKFDAVLSHELAHIARRDLLWQNIICTTRVLYWFHPFAWFVAHRVRTEQELACDDMVLESGKRPSDYASMLLELSKNLSLQEKIPEGGLAMLRKKTVAKRIDSILDKETSRKPISRKATLGILLGVLSLSLGISFFAPKITLPSFVQAEETVKEQITSEAEEKQPEENDEMKTAQSLPESTDRERVSKYETFGYLLPANNEKKKPEGHEKTKLVLDEMVRIARLIELPSLRSEKILLIVQKMSDDGQWDEYEKLFTSLLPLHRAQATAFQSAVEEMKSGKSDAAKKRITDFESRILKMPNNYEKGVAAIFCFSCLGKLGFIDEAVDWVKNIKGEMMKPDKSNNPPLSEEEEHWLGYILDRSFRNAVSDVGFYWTRQDEWDKAFDYACRMYEIGKPASCVTDSCDSIMRFVTDHYVKEDELDKAMQIARRIREATGKSAQWEAYGIFKKFLEKDNFDRALEIARNDDSFNSLVQKSMYDDLIKYRLDKNDKKECIELLDEALEKSGNLESAVDRFSDFERYVRIAMKIGDSAKIGAIEAEARKRFEAAMKDGTKWPGGDIASERSKVHVLCELAAVQFRLGKTEEAKESFREAIRQADSVAEMEPKKESQNQRDAALSGVARSQATLGLNEDAYTTVERIDGNEWKTEGWWYLCSFYIGKKDLRRTHETLAKAKECLKTVNNSRIFGNVIYLENQLKELEKNAGPSITVNGLPTATTNIGVPFTFAGTVVNQQDKKAIEGATILVQFWDGPDFVNGRGPAPPENCLWEGSFKTDVNGKYSFDLPATLIGKRNLFVKIMGEHPDYINTGHYANPIDEIMASQRLGKDEKMGDFQFEPAVKVHGTVQSPDGKPVADVLVQAESQREIGSDAFFASTDEQGKFAVKAHVDASLVLSVLFRDFAPIVKQFDKTPINAGVLKAEPGVTANGIMYDRNRKPVAGVWINLTEKESPARHPQHKIWRSSLTDENGRFSFNPVAFGNYFVEPSVSPMDPLVVFDGKRYADMNMEGIQTLESRKQDGVPSYIANRKPVPDVYLAREFPTPTDSNSVQLSLTPAPMVSLHCRFRDSSGKPFTQPMHVSMTGMIDGRTWQGLYEPAAVDADGTFMLDVPKGLEKAILICRSIKRDEKGAIRFRIGTDSKPKTDWCIEFDKLNKNINDLEIVLLKPAILRLTMIDTEGNPVEGSLPFGNIKYVNPELFKDDDRAGRGFIMGFGHSLLPETVEENGRLLTWQPYPVLPGEELIVAGREGRTIRDGGQTKVEIGEKTEQKFVLQEGETRSVKLFFTPKKQDGEEDKPSQTIETKTFTLTILDESGKPVPDAQVKVGDITFQADEVLAGRIGEEKQYFLTDENGRLTLKQKLYTGWFFCYITTPGHALYLADWHKPNPVPDEFTARLDAGRSVGGRVVDPKGKPIAGALLNLLVPAKRPPGNLENSTPRTTVRTDAQGYWRCDYVPATLETLQMQIAHPDFRSLPWTNVPVRDCAISLGATPAFRQTLQSGFVLTGKITDSSGKPIEGASVSTPSVLWATRSAQTDAKGVYHLRGNESGTQTLLAQAENHASVFRNVAIDTQGNTKTDETNFVLEKAVPLRLKFVDSEGKAIPDVRLSFSQWKNISLSGFDTAFSLRSDADGRWAWNEAPVGELTGYLQGNGNVVDIANFNIDNNDEKENEIILRRPPIVIGNVVDSSSRKPIREFTVTAGDVDVAFVNQNDFSAYASWDHYGKQTFEDDNGRYRFTITRPADQRTKLIKVETQGYKPGYYRVGLKPENETRIDAALEPAESLGGRVLLPNSEQVASGATVTLARSSAALYLENGRITGHNNFIQQQTDTAGRFAFSKPEDVFCLVATHKNGFALIWSDGFDPKEPVRLEAWGRLEGVLHIGDQPAPAGISMELTSDLLKRKKNTGNQNWPSVLGMLRGTTDGNGRFVIGPVPAGSGHVYRTVTCQYGKQGGTASGQSGNTAVVLEPGKLTTVELGGNGQAVIGRVATALKDVDWKYGMVSLVKPGAPDHPSLFAATIEADGTFRIDNVIPGDYRVLVQLYSATSEEYEVIGKAEKRFALPTPDNEMKPFDMGTLNLESVKP